MAVGAREASCAEIEKRITDLRAESKRFEEARDRKAKKEMEKVLGKSEDHCQERASSSDVVQTEEPLSADEKKSKKKHRKRKKTT